MLFNCAGYLVAFKNIEFNYVCVPYAGYRFLHILSFKYTVNRNPRVICSVVITEYIECHYKSVRHRVLELYAALKCLAELYLDT